MKVHRIDLDDDGKPSEITVTMSAEDAALIVAFFFNLSTTAMKVASGESGWSTGSRAIALDNVFCAFYDNGYHEVVPAMLTKSIHEWGQSLNALAQD